MRSRTYACAALVALGLALTPASGAAQASSRCAAGGKPQSARILARQVVCLINAERKSRGLRALRAQRRLARAARRYSPRMAAANSLSHYLGGTPLSRVASTGYLRGSPSWALGETLGWIAPGRGAASLVRAWMRSPVHRMILLTPGWRDIGVGAAKGSPFARRSGGWSVTAEFGRR